MYIILKFWDSIIPCYKANQGIWFYSILINKSIGGWKPNKIKTDSTLKNKSAIWNKIWIFLKWNVKNMNHGKNYNFTVLVFIYIIVIIL